MASGVSLWSGGGHGGFLALLGDSGPCDCHSFHLVGQCLLSCCFLVAAE